MRIPKAWLLAVVALCLAQGAPAQVTVTGGTVTATASAGDPAPGYTFQSDTPAPVNVSPSGVTTLTASANGTGPAFPPTLTGTASAAATGTVTLQSTASGETATLFAQTSMVFPIQQGPGSWQFASSSAAATLFLTLAQPETVSVSMSGLLVSSGNLTTGTIEQVGGPVLFTDNTLNPQSTNLALKAGQYEFLVTSATEGGQFQNGDGTLQVTFPSPVPLPAGAWLLGSGLAGLVLLGSRLRQAPRPSPAS